MMTSPIEPQGQNTGSKQQATHHRTAWRRALLGIVFKAGDVSEECELQFSYRAISLLGND